MCADEGGALRLTNQRLMTCQIGSGGVKLEADMQNEQDHMQMITGKNECRPIIGTGTRNTIQQAMEYCSSCHHVRIIQYSVVLRGVRSRRLLFPKIGFFSPPSKRMQTSLLRRRASGQLTRLGWPGWLLGKVELGTDLDRDGRRRQSKFAHHHEQRIPACCWAAWLEWPCRHAS